MRDVEISVANAAERSRLRTLHHMATRCKALQRCLQCTAHLITSAQNYPCNDVQQVFRLLQHRFDGVSSTHLRECK